MLEALTMDGEVVVLARRRAGPTEHVGEPEGGRQDPLAASEEGWEVGGVSSKKAAGSIITRWRRSGQRGHGKGNHNTVRPVLSMIMRHW